MDKEVDIEYLYSRCSICFDQHLDFCLQECKDQFCKTCFSRYVQELVKCSWGLSVRKIQCPVCLIPIPQHEWARYVDDSIVRLYDHFNQPFRPIQRHCSKCEAEHIIACKPICGQSAREKQFERTLELLEKLVPTYCPRFKADYKNHLSGGSVETFDIYQETMQELGRKLKIAVSQARFHSSVQTLPNDKLSLLIQISNNLISLETRKKQWRELQFKHVASFPEIVCSNCSETQCFSCSESPFHSNQSCHQYLEQKVLENDHTIDNYSEKMANWKWKLTNTKRCPQCSILINREEGCNKVDCLFCDYSFCWNCESKFDNGNCGFYRCHLDPFKQDKEKKTIDFKFELGVPNVYQIEAKFGYPK